MVLNTSSKFFPWFKPPFFYVVLWKDNIIIKKQKAVPHYSNSCKKLTSSALRATVQGYQQGNSHDAERLRQAFSPLVSKLSHRHCVYSVLGEDAENTLWMIFYDFLYKYTGDDYKHLPGLIRRHLIQRLINTLKKEGKRWDVEHYLDEDALSNKPYGKDDLQDVLNNLALAQEMDLLPSEQAQLLKDVYYNETTQKQVAYSTNCSTRSIRRHQTKVLSALRSKLIS